MTTPALRLLDLLELLEGRDVVSAEDVAARLEVDRRSVRRYITHLRDIGIPIESARGPYGGYRLVAGFRVPPLMFTHDELAALLIGLRLVQEIGAVTPDASTKAIQKIVRVLPPALSDQAAALHLYLSITRWPSPSHAIHSQKLFTISHAAATQHALHIHYRGANDHPTSRDISPYGVVLHGGAWYVAAYCHLRADMRVFRLDRVELVTTTDRPFRTDPTLDAQLFVYETLAALPGLTPYEVLLYIDITTAEIVLPPGAGLLSAQGANTHLRCYSDDPFWVARLLCGLAVPFHVLGPDDLRAACRTLASELLAAQTGTLESANE